MSWEEQGIIFAACCLCGAAIGIGADGYRAWQSAVRTKRITTTVLDCLLWCAFASLVFALMFIMNGGDMRSYVFLALITGYLGYRRAAGERIVRLWLWCARAVRTVLRFLRRIIITICLPIRVCFRAFVGLVRRIARLLTLMRKSPPEEKN